jgi:hypothetical protein
MSETLDAIAKDAVERIGIASRIEEMRKPLHEQLRRCESIASASAVDADTMFFSLALPVVHGLIQLTTSRPRLAKGVAWVHENWPGSDDAVDPLAILTALTLLYVVRSAVEHADSEREEREWRRIYARVARLIDDGHPIPA